jgi:DNA-binding CsgD family transcriptional regulator
MTGQRAHRDWDEIRRFYEAGHSSVECRKRFGFGGSSWDRAVKRGDIRPRRGGQGLVNEERREAVLGLVGEGLPRVEVARRLGVSISTVAYYVRQLGLGIDERCARRYDWTEVQRFHDRGHSTRECMERFGFSSQTWHEARGRGVLRTRSARAPIETYLVKGRAVGRGHLKRRLLAEGLKENRCEECGLDEWRGKPLPLALHHVNGDGDDNRLQNLQLLCGNCHSQTPNFSAKNKGKQRRLPQGAIWIRNVPHRRLPVRGVAV